MALFDKLRKGQPGEPARARVIVNRSPGVEVGQSSLKTTANIRLALLPSGSEHEFRGLIPTLQAELIAAGMEIPVLVSGDEIVALGEPMDEAIGRYYLTKEPDAFATWREAFDAKAAAVRRTTGMFGGIRHMVDQARDAATSAKELPDFARDAKQEWSDAIGDMAADFKADGTAQAAEAARCRDVRANGTPVMATVISRTPTGERQGGAPVYTLILELEQDGAKRQISHVEALNDTWPPSLQPGQTDTVFLDPDDSGRVVLGLLHGVNA
ncbi:MAG: hypothetical protein JHC95_22250 [Solirubrobacteraceae bacterium]|nr:hypothetical protein [Solirubrobacteraceae bacterium]